MPSLGGNHKCIDICAVQKRVGAMGLGTWGIWEFGNLVNVQTSENCFHISGVFVFHGKKGEKGKRENEKTAKGGICIL